MGKERRTMGRGNGQVAEKVYNIEIEGVHCTLYNIEIEGAQHRNMSRVYNIEIEGVQHRNRRFTT